MKTVRLNVNVQEEFAVSLKAIPTTGYTWGAQFDETMVQLKGKNFDLDPSSVIGGGGTETFTFTPIRKGETVVIMCYKREWEEKALEEIHYHIVITE
jgi:predicted secreted protein